MAAVPHRTATPLPFSTEQFYLSEGPYIIKNPNDWHNTLFSFVNIQTNANQPGQLHIVSTGDWSHQVYDLPEPVGFAFPAEKEESKFVLGLGQGVAVYDKVTKGINKFIPQVKENDTLVNDALLIDEGLVFGTKHLQTPQKLAGLWFYSYENHNQTQLLSNLKISNGMDTIHDEHGNLWLIHTDTPDCTIKKYRFDPKTGTFDRNGVVLIDVSDTKAYPDGLTLSPDKKHLILALWNDDENATQGEARQYNLETGKLERIFVVPGAPRVTCPILVKDKVIITSAWEGSEKLKKAQPNSGRIFVADTTCDGFDFGPIPESLKFRAKL